MHDHRTCADHRVGRDRDLGSDHRARAEKRPRVKRQPPPVITPGPNVTSVGELAVMTDQDPRLIAQLKPARTPAATIARAFT